MKILIVNHYYATHGGGIEQVIRQLLHSLRDVAPDLAFTWAASDCDASHDGPNFVCLPMRCNNAIERRCGVPQPLWYPQALRQLAAAIKQHDVIWLHDTLYMGNIAAYLIAKWQRKPIVITQHIGMIPYNSRTLRTLLRLGNRLVAVPMLKYANHSVFIAAQVRTYFNDRIKHWRNKPRLIHNGVNHAIFKPVTADRRLVLRQKFGIDEEPMLLFVGRFVAKKGLPILEKLTLALPEYAWVFAGRGSLDPAGWLRNNCMTIRDRNGAGVAELYQAADLLVLPSIGEGLPLVIQEAAACGLPVLCATETATADPRLTPLLYTAAVVAHDPESTSYNWAAQLRSIVADTDDRAVRSGALAALAAEHWSWSRAAERYVKLFRRLSPPPSQTAVQP
jgi:glycosyltransferase involved in cell wall biosynthesis